MPKSTLKRSRDESGEMVLMCHAHSRTGCPTFFYSGCVPCEKARAKDIAEGREPRKSADEMQASKRGGSASGMISKDKLRPVNRRPGNNLPEWERPNFLADTLALYDKGIIR